MTEDRSNIGGTRRYLSWSHIRPSVVVPIGVIVAVAIVCVVVAALSSAQRADDVALENERQLFTRALTNQGERVLRDIAAVATSEAAYRRIRVSFDSDWVQISVGLPLDILVARRDACDAELNYRIEPGEPYFHDLRERWSAALRAAHNAIPRPPYKVPT